MRVKFSYFASSRNCFSFFWRHVRLIGSTRAKGDLAEAVRPALSLKWLAWTSVLIAALGAVRGNAQTTPSTPPTNRWVSAEPSSWFNAENWSRVAVPSDADDVGIGSVETAEIPANDTPATARTVTLGVVIEGTYSRGELDVIEGTLNITPLIGTVNPGLQVLAGSTLTIGEGGTVKLGAFTVENFGQINVGADESGGTLIAGTVINHTTGDINGGLTFPEGGTVENAGHISGLIFSGVTGPGMIFDGNGTITNTGTISGSDAIELEDGGSVTNTGSISGTGNGEGVRGVGVEFFDGGSVTNNAGGNISGTSRGVASPIILPDSGVTTDAIAAADPPAVTVVNSGIISGATGVEIDAGGSVTNNAGGSIQGTGGELPGDGIGIAALPNEELAPSPLTVVNSGTVSGATGVEIDGGGSVTNNVGGLIRGTDGIGIAALPNEEVAPAPLTVVNSGTISGITAGIDLEAGGSITNNPGGLIVSGTGNPAVIANGGSLIFLNAGTIAGSVTLDTLPGAAANFANQATLVTGGTIAGDLNLGTNRGTTLTLDGSGSEALSQAVTGLITNDGSVIKQGTGTWVIDKSLGNNPGGTTVRAGTLTDALTNALGTGPITVTGNTSLLQVKEGVAIANPVLITLTDGGMIDNAGTISPPPGGLISGAGGGNVTNEGTGIIINPAGNTVIFNAGGTLTNRAGGLIQSETASGIISTGGQTSIMNSGTISGLTGISLTGGGSVTNSAGGVISGRTGLAILSGGGSTKISNAGTINGNVFLGNSANTLQLFSGGRINGNLNLGTSSASNLILDGPADQSLSQAISGTTTNAGSLTKQGSGNWTVDVAMSAPVSTNILAGVLTVNQPLKSALVTIQAGGMLKGSSNILGSVVNVGTISPGNSPGTLTISGNFTQGPAGTYNVEIFSPQNYSRLVVVGHASLDGTLHLTLASGFHITPGETFTVLTAGQGISGTFRTISGNTPVNVTYANGEVFVNAASTTRVKSSDIHLSDGTPDSTTALLADYTFYGFGSLSERMALGLIPSEEPGKENAVSLTFDAGEFDIQGQHGQTYTIPIAGGFKINDRVRLDYEVPLQYITIDNTSLFQAGLTLDLPVKVVIPSVAQPWSWTATPTAAVATSGSKEFIGGGALTNVFSYQWHGITATYGNYISFFEGHLFSTDDPKFPNGVSQQIMKNGLRLDVPFAKSWIIETYGIYTQFFQTAAISSYWTIGAEIGHHFTWDVEGQHLDLGYLSLGLYTEFGNQYSQYHSGHAQIGSAWRF
jgi:hypothetical protein